jgi:fimbrial chaperone protein
MQPLLQVGARPFRRRLAAARTVLILLCVGATSACWAGSFQVNPIKIYLSAAKRSAALTITNTGSEALVVQMSARAWTQKDGKDVLSETPEVLVSPPIATIPAGKEQIVRVGLRRAPDAHRELSYRLFVQEVPPPPKPGFQGLQVALRVGLPIFVEPRDGPAKVNLVWEANLEDESAIQLKVQNLGTGHIQISDVQLSLPGEQQPVAMQSGLTYVLPGQAHEWDIKLRQASVKKNDRLQLKATTDAGSIETAIGLGNP